MKKVDGLSVWSVRKAASTLLYVYRDTEAYEMLAGAYARRFDPPGLILIQPFWGKYSDLKSPY